MTLLVPDKAKARCTVLTSLIHTPFDMTLYLINKHPPPVTRLLAYDVAGS